MICVKLTLEGKYREFSKFVQRAQGVRFLVAMQSNLQQKKHQQLFFFSQFRKTLRQVDFSRLEDHIFVQTLVMP